MSKVLILSGSPRKNGNTETLVNALAEGASLCNEVEILTVADFDINPCIGCNSCYANDGHRCFRKDDMDIIYEKMKNADILVIASPVYFYGISSQLKAVIDRLHTPMRNEFKIRKLALVLVGAASIPDLFDPVVMQYRMILRFFKLADAGMVLAGGVKDKGDVASTSHVKDAYILGVTL